MKIPLIKENHVEKIIECLQCIDKHAYDREKIRDCVLELYPGKTEKSVFRGMVIPTLRDLGLIVGYGEFIRVSANGKLMLRSQDFGKYEFKRILRAVFLEIDNSLFKFILELEKLGKYRVLYNKFLNNMIKKIEGPNRKQKKERIDRWWKMVEQCELVTPKSKTISILSKNLSQAKKELEFRKKRRFFKEYLFKSYSALAPQSAGIVNITDLRADVASQIYSEKREILTEIQFDNLLRELPIITNEYKISLGRPMGAEEKLFRYKGDYYITLSIDIFHKEEVDRG